MKTVSLKYTEPGQEPALKEFRLWHVSPCGNLGVIHDLDWHIVHIRTGKILDFGFYRKADATKATDAISGEDWSAYPDGPWAGIRKRIIATLREIPHRAYSLYATNIGPNGATRVRIR